MKKLSSMALDYAVVTLKPHFERFIRKGQLWAYDNEVEAVEGDPQPGDIVRVRNYAGKDLGLAFYNPHSKIRIRLLLTHTAPITADFFADRIRNAYLLRQQLIDFQQNTMYRLVFSESDFLPGLVVDIFDRYAAIQMLAYGLERLSAEIQEALLQVLPDLRGIYAKNDSVLRQKEGLPQYEETLWGSIPEEIICLENNLRFCINIASGQKTGFFLDQKTNRRWIQKFARDRAVLDCFSNQGGFALNAAAAGARSITAVDSSAPALAIAQRNFELNGFSKQAVEFVCDDVFDFLLEAKRAGRQWDLIILDPPAFTKSKEQIPAAIRGYARLHRLAFRVLAPDGILATSSCSYHIDEERFLRIVQEEALRAGRFLQLLYRGQQSPDHPILPAMPQTKYLKFFLFRCLQSPAE